MISIYSHEEDVCYLIGGIPDVMGDFESHITSFLSAVCTIFNIYINFEKYSWQSFNVLFDDHIVEVMLFLGIIIIKIC